MSASHAGRLSGGPQCCSKGGSAEPHHSSLGAECHLPAHTIPGASAAFPAHLVPSLGISKLGVNTKHLLRPGGISAFLPSLASRR